MNFKVGDKVIITTSNRSYEYYGYPGTVIEILSTDNGQPIVINFNGKRGGNITRPFAKYHLTIITRKEFFIKKFLPKYRN